MKKLELINDSFICNVNTFIRGGDRIRTYNKITVEEYKDRNDEYFYVVLLYLSEEFIDESYKGTLEEDYEVAFDFGSLFVEYNCVEKIVGIFETKDKAKEYMTENYKNILENIFSELDLSEMENIYYVE